MAVHFAAGANYAQRTAGGFLNPATVSTVMMWAKFGTVPAGPSYQVPYILIDDPAVYVQYVATYADTASLVLNVAGGGFIGPVSPPVAGVWYHLAWVQNTTTQIFYVNGIQIGTAIVNRTGWTIGYEMLGNDSFATSDIDLQYFRSWQAVLSAEQIRTEMQSATAVVAAPFMNTPLTANLNDISGNARNWTLVGADSFVTGPTIPTNSSPSTALEISGLPTTVTRDFGDAFYEWFFYTGVPADLLVSFWAFCTLSDTLQVDISYGTALSRTNLSQAINVPFELPTSNGDTFYFRVFCTTGQPSGDVVITADIRPTSDVPAGSIVVNDDGNADVNGLNFPAAFLDGGSGATLAFARAAAGETGMVFPPTGAVCLYDALTATVNIYPKELGTATSTIADATFHSGGPTKVINSDQTTQFYVGGFQSGTTCHAFTLSPTGTIGATDYPITITGATSLKCMAPDQANTVLYYGDTGTATALRRWDLVNNIALSDLAAGVASHQNNEDLLVLADGTILAAYIKATATTDYFVRQYSAAGAILHTYSSFGATNRIHRMAHSLDDPDAFWVWLYLDDDPGASYGGGVSRFVQVDVATGAFITTIDAVNFENGVYNAAPDADPILFGHSFSCPFWIQRGSITPPGPGEPEEFLIRRERWFPVLNQENQRMTFSMLQVDLQAGNGLTEGQGENPLLELDWSDDAGWTWSNIRFLPTGRIGQYNRRAIARVLGQSRQRVFRIAVSDPCQFVVLDGYMQIKGGTS